MEQDLDKTRELLYRQTVEGDQATTALAVLGQWCDERERQIMSRIVMADTPAKAWETACELKAMRNFVAEMRNKVIIGTKAAEDLISTEV